MDFVFKEDEQDQTSYELKRVDGAELVQHLNVPDSYKGKPVKRISGFAFSKCEKLQTVTLPAGIAFVSEDAFGDCPDLVGIYVNNLGGFDSEEGYFSNDGTLYWRYCDGEAKLVRCAPNKTCAEFIVPEDVTEIAPFAFCDCKNIGRIVLPSGVTFIGNYAFLRCENLTNVNIPTGVTEIADGTFHDCKNLDRIVLPRGVENVSTNALCNCNRLRSIDLDGDNTGGEYNYTASDGILYADGGKTLVRYAPAKSDTTFVVPSEITKISEYAFSGCSSLTKVVLPRGIVSIELSTFESCVNLVRVIIPGAERIESDAFYHCERLVDITLSRKLEYVSPCAFNGCYSLRFINMVADGDWNSKYAVIDGNLYTDAGKTLVKYASGKVDEEFIVPREVVSIGDRAFADSRNLKSLVLHNDVKSIGEYAFCDCENLEHLVLPCGDDSLFDDYSYSFYGCSSLRYINVCDNVGDSYYTAVDDVLYADSGRVLVKYAAAKPDVEFTIPASVVNVAIMAFAEAKNLESLTMPENVEFVGNHAFSNCSNLTLRCDFEKCPDGWDDYWDMVDSDTDDKVKVEWLQVESFDARRKRLRKKNYLRLLSCIFKAEGNAFLNFVNGLRLKLKLSSDGKRFTVIGVRRLAVNAKKLTIPAKFCLIPINSVDKFAFGKCKNLEAFVLPEHISIMDSLGFDGSEKLSSIEIYPDDKPGYLSGRLFTADGNLYNEYESYTGDGFEKKKSFVRYIPTKADTEFRIPNGVTYIRDGAFCYCRNLRSIIIPESVKHIGEYVFEGCDQLDDLIIPNSVDRFEHALDRCGMRSVSVPHSGHKYTGHTFYGCSNLSSINLNEDVGAEKRVDENEGEYISIFGNLYREGGKTLAVYAPGKSDAEFAVPEGVAKIDDCAFYGCKNLKKVIIPLGVEAIDSFAFNTDHSITLCCEAAEKPAGWCNDWDKWINSLYNRSAHAVIWGYKDKSPKEKYPENQDRVDKKYKKKGYRGKK